MQCVTHGLAAGPDGRCALCGREERRTQSRRVWAATGVVTVACVLASVGIWALKRPVPPEESPAPSVASPLAAPDQAEVIEETEAIEEVEAPPAVTDTVAAAPPPRPAARWNGWDTPKPDAATGSTRDSGTGAVARGAARQEPDRKAEREMRVRTAMARVPMTVYMAPWCPACREAVQWLRENGVAHREIDVEADSSASARMRRLNPRGTIPTIDVAGTVLVGFSPSRIKKAIRAAAEREVARTEM